MKLVAVPEIPAEPFREELADRGFAGARDAHDHDHGGRGRRH
jgi:hypothetical protein